MIFKDRIEAGQKLADKLAQYKGKEAIIYALPRGGVVLGKEIKEKIGGTLDLLIIRKVGHPYDPEYAVGAVAEDGHTILNEKERKQIDESLLKGIIEKEQKEARRRREAYLSGKPSVPAAGKIAILVDDGVATGLSMELAIDELRHQKPEKIIVAVPVIPIDVAEKFRQKADELIALDIPSVYLGAVGAYYSDFPQIEDAEVIKILSNQ
jgi:predicted phosphoribosyltransferase